jgi:multiple sugar transport system permease protein
MAGLALSKSQHIKSKRTLLDMMRESKWLFMGLFIGPAILLILIVIVVPMLYSLYLSFTDYNLLNARNSSFIGIENYIELFKDKVFITSFVRTFVFMTLTVNLELLFGLLIALLLSKPLKGESFLRIILMVPMMFPPILVGFQFKWIFNDQAGLLNNLLYSLTGQLHQIPWLIDQPYGFLSILIAELWMGTPFMAIILLAGMMSLPKEPFEAADIDGASGFQKFYYITRPMLMPYMLIAMAIRSLDISRAYDLVKIMTNGGPAQRTELIWTYVTRLSIVDSKFAMGCAMSFVSVLISFAFTIMIYKQLIAARRGLG